MNPAARDAEGAQKVVEDRLSALFTAHPASVGETYLQHCRAACGFAGQFALCAAACLVHAFLPFVFSHSASARLQRLNQAIARQKSKLPNASSNVEIRKPTPSH